MENVTIMKIFTISSVEKQRTQLTNSISHQEFGWRHERPRIKIGITGSPSSICCRLRIIKPCMGKKRICFKR